MKLLYSHEADYISRRRPGGFCNYIITEDGVGGFFGAISNLEIVPPDKIGNIQIGETKHTSYVWKLKS